MPLWGGGWYPCIRSKWMKKFFFLGFKHPIVVNNAQDAVSNFFLLAKFQQKMKFKIQNLWIKWFWSLPIASENKSSEKLPDFYTWFLMCSQNIERRERICIFIFGLQPNLAKSYHRRSPFFLHLIMEDSHFGYKQKIFTKKHSCFLSKGLIVLTLRYMLNTKTKKNPFSRLESMLLIGTFSLVGEVLGLNLTWCNKTCKNS